MSMWRPPTGAFGSGLSLGTSLAAPPASSALYASTSSASLTSRFLWKHSHHSRLASGHAAPAFAREAKQRWLAKLELHRSGVAETLGLLACGYCGELVDDNRQCVECTQLYCASCVARLAPIHDSEDSNSASFKCFKCHVDVLRSAMRRNELAQQQAAALALSMSHGGVHADATDALAASLSLDDMQRALEASVPRAAAVDLRAGDLTPGRDLAALSNGQLEVLDEAHAVARAEIVAQLLANARALARLEMEEWLKHRRDALGVPWPR